jgi:SAM-dependent methyltransferase
LRNTKTGVKLPAADINKRSRRMNEARTALHPGDAHYTAYVGFPALYDVMGASQFALLFTLGLRSFHKLLDLGCGSLRAGRFLVSYLDAGHYYGLEPNRWLIEEAIAKEVGHDLVALKRPNFAHNDEFRADAWDTKFDFVLAQSIFSHTGQDLLRQALDNLRQVMSVTGRIVATFVEGDADHAQPGWLYPLCCHYRPLTIQAFVRDAGLKGVRIPWYHPNDQTWYVLAKDDSLLPTRAMFHALQGAMLGDEQFRLSWDRRLRSAKRAAKWVPRPLKSLLKKVVRKQPGL